MNVMMAFATALTYAISFGVTLGLISNQIIDCKRNNIILVASVHFGIGTFCLLAFIALTFGQTA